MGKAADLYVKITAKDATAQGVGTAEKRLNTLSGSASKLTAAFAGAFAISRVVSFGAEAVKLYDIQAQAETQLLTALKGREGAQQRLIKQAQQLQGITLYGDEDTIRAQALIAAFVEEEAQIKKIIPLVQDMATAKQMSLAGAADLVSKTLGSQTNALSRYGIAVSGTVGSVDRLDSLMTGLNDAFGGQAAAAALQGAGSIKQLENAIGDLKEEIGKLIVTGDTFSSWITGSITEVQQWAAIIGDENRSGFKNWMLFLAGSKDRWAEVAAEIEAAKKKQQDYNKAQEESAYYSDDNSNRNQEQEDYYDSLLKILEPITTVRDRIGEVNTSIKTQQKIINDPNVSFVAAQEAFKEAEKLKKELIQLKQILSYSTTRAAVPAKMESIGTPEIKDSTPDLLHFDDESMAKATAQSKEKLRVMYAEIQAETDRLNNELSLSMAEGFAAGIETAFSGAGIESVLGAFLAPIGSFMVKMGTLLIANGMAIEVFKQSLENLEGAKAIAAGAALVATGAAFKSFVGGGVGGSSSGSYSGGSAYSNYQPVAKANNSINVVVSGQLVASGKDMVWQASKNDYIINRTLGS